MEDVIYKKEMKMKDNGHSRSLIGLFLIAIFLLIIVILLPFCIWGFRLIYDSVKGGYDSNWLGFFESYLGGVLGGLATLVAVVYTIQLNKKEQEEKEEKEKEKIFRRVP